MTRSEQKEQRKKEIIFCALDIFVRKGFSETKITDIAGKLNMSMGLLFHYFESKEQLYKTLVQMGVDGSKSPQKIQYSDPIEYFQTFLTGLFTTVVEQPWIYQMFVLMIQAGRPGIPEDIREIALSVNQVEESSHVIEMGQKTGTIKQGDPIRLSRAFWSSVQGIMEQHAISPEEPLPEVDWIMSIIRKENQG